MVARIGFGVHVAHGFLLLAPDAVLAGDRTTEIDADLENAQREVDRNGLLAGMGGVIEHDGVQVSVACVEDVGDAQANLLGHLADPLEDFR